MTVKDAIDEFLQKLHSQLDEHDSFFIQWGKTDWHERSVCIDKLLHGMWSIYEDAEDIAEAMRNSFPPYPFKEIKDIKRWLKRASHQMTDFLEDEYKCTDSNEYMHSYGSFLNKVCDINQNSILWKSREQHLVDNEHELITMLNKSYSVLLDLMLSCYQQIQENDTNTLLAYSNCKARYEQLYWTDKHDKGAFLLTMDKLFPWDQPTKMQLQDLYQTKLNELKKTRIGRIYVNSNHFDFVTKISKLSLSDTEIMDFFREQKELEELLSMINDYVTDIVDDNLSSSAGKKRGPHEHYLFIDGKPTIENVFVKNQEKFRFMQYIKAHNLSNRELSCNKNDSINNILTCFLLHWKERKLTSDTPSGGAIFRFLTNDCGFRSGVMLESFANEIKDRLKNKQYDIKTYQSVSNSFTK